MPLARIRRLLTPKQEVKVATKAASAPAKAAAAIVTLVKRVIAPLKNLNTRG